MRRGEGTVAIWNDEIQRLPIRRRRWSWRRCGSALRLSRFRCGFWYLVFFERVLAQYRGCLVAHILEGRVRLFSKNRTVEYTRWCRGKNCPRKMFRVRTRFGVGGRRWRVGVRPVGIIPVGISRGIIVVVSRGDRQTQQWLRHRVHRTSECRP